MIQIPMPPAVEAVEFVGSETEEMLGSSQIDWVIRKLTWSAAVAAAVRIWTGLDFVDSSFCQSYCDTKNDLKQGMNSKIR